MSRGRSHRLILMLGCVAATLVPLSPVSADVADPCAVPADNDYCAQAPPGGAACLAVSIGLTIGGGSLTPTILQSQASSVGAPAHQERHFVNQNLASGAVRVTAADSSCDASANPVPSASGTADASTFAIDLTGSGVPVQLSGDLLREAGSSGSSNGNAATISRLTGSIGPIGINQVVDAAPNTVIPLGGSDFLELNGQFSSSGSCHRNTGAALRLHLDGFSLDLVVGWVSTVACKLPANVQTFSQPSGDVGLGSGVSDLAIVSGAGPTPTGTVTFFLCGPGPLPAGCEAPNGALIGSAPLTGGQAFAPTVVPQQPGRYCWRAAYSGDAVYLPAVHTNPVSECVQVIEPEPVEIQTESQPSGPGVAPGTPVHDIAFVFGAGDPTGFVRFYICRPFEVVPNVGCPQPSGEFVGDAPVQGSMAFSPPFFDTFEPGVYCWRAEYSGDVYNQPGTHTNYDTECFEIAQPQQDIDMSTISQPQGCCHPPGVMAFDTAFLSGNGPPPTGTVRFFICNPMQVQPMLGCPEPLGQFVGEEPVQMSGAQSQPFFNTLNPGVYCWRAVYSGDSNYFPRTHTDFLQECFEVI